MLHSKSDQLQAIADARKKVRALGYDPYKIKDYNHTVGLFEMKMTNTWVTGVSSFYRVGEIVVGVDNLTVSIAMQIGTQKINGASEWEVLIGSGMITRSGQIQFTIDHINAMFEINQSLDMRKRPEIKDLQLELGNIQVSGFEHLLLPYDEAHVLILSLLFLSK